MSDTGITFEAKIAVRTPEQQGEECRRAYELGSTLLTYIIESEADTRSKSRRIRRWTVKATKELGHLHQRSRGSVNG